MRKLVPVVAVLSALGIAVIAPVSRAEVQPVGCRPEGQCCKICEAGQACGNTCISATKACHKGRGCACNASEICGR